MGKKSKKKDQKMVRIISIKEVDVEGRERITIKFGFIELPRTLIEITEYVPETELKEFDDLVKPGEAIQASVRLLKDDVIKIYDEYMVALGNELIELNTTIEGYQKILEEVSEDKKRKKDD